MLKILIYEFGKFRHNGFPKISPQAQISKTLPPGDLENDIMILIENLKICKHMQDFCPLTE